MGIIKEMQKNEQLTEREKDIRNYILAHPENLDHFTSRDLGAATFTSAASVTRFCKKMGCEGYQEFKLRFLSDIRSGSSEGEKMPVIAPKENVAVIMAKIYDIQKRVLDETRSALSLAQMYRVGGMLAQAKYIDFYAYDVNVHLAEYACNQFFYCGKVANTYIATNSQQFMAMMGKEGHLAVIISRTGENSRLMEIARQLKRQQVPTIVITIGREHSLGFMGDEMLVAATETRVEELGTVMFSSSVKYILDVMFCMTFSQCYEDNVKKNAYYEKLAREKNLWALFRDFN
ncbi:MAG: MurR/RpiR family transcriptional regulator [bacterium]|nr:MurR/RpiR family transcriptional regulator [bacterium]